MILSNNGFIIDDMGIFSATKGSIISIGVLSTTNTIESNKNALVILSRAFLYISEHLIYFTKNVVFRLIFIAIHRNFKIQESR